MTTLLSVQSEVEEHLAAAARAYRALNRSRPQGQMLAEQEMQVAVLYALTQMSAAGIGAKLNVTEDTVKSVLRRVFRKLRINARAELPLALAHIEPRQVTA